MVAQSIPARLIGACVCTAVIIAACICIRFAESDTKMTKSDMVDIVLAETKPLKLSRGQRLPLYVWSCHDVATDDDAETERRLRALDSRGIAAICSWDTSKRETSLRRALRTAEIQKKLGFPVSVNANSCMHRLCNGDRRTAHITNEGKPFFDGSFAKSVKMGCPFALDFRYDDIKEQMEYFLRAYKERGIPVDFIFADWEIDGPIEWNNAWENSKRCMRCRENIPDIDDFSAFQRALRIKRSEIQRKVFAEPVLSYFPDALVGNYGVYPHDGYRYWIDYFENKTVPEGIPHKKEQNGRYRQWFHEFPLTRYTTAIPVVYTWGWSYGWYGYEDSDFRWFYNLLLTATNVCKSTSRDTPIISFVHHTTIWYPLEPDEEVEQFSPEMYKELLWHMLLRGCDGLFLWCIPEETAREIRPLHEVYASSLAYRDFLERGEPITFDVPQEPGPVVSGLRLGKRLLVRRTDFTDTTRDLVITVDEQKVRIPHRQGACQLIELD